MLGEDFSKMSVMIVEDQPDARAILRNMLGEFSVTQIFEAADGNEALRFVDSAFDMIDMVICDWNMPKMDGVQLLRQIRSVGFNMPFLMITGRGDMDSVIEAKSSGISGYIRKPFSPQELEVKMRVIVKKAEAA